MSKDVREAFNAWIKAAPKGWEMLASPSRLMAFEAGWNARTWHHPQEGWVLVPLDDPKLRCSDSHIPDEMVIAGIDAYEATQDWLANGGVLSPDGSDVGMIVLEIYRAMVAARPKLPGAWLNEEVSLPSRPAPATRAESVRAGSHAE